MLTGLKCSSLACKCVNFTEHNTKGGRDPMELNFEGLEIHKPIELKE